MTGVVYVRRRQLLFAGARLPGRAGQGPLQDLDLFSRFLALTKPQSLKGRTFQLLGDWSWLRRHAFVCGEPSAGTICRGVLKALGAQRMVGLLGVRIASWHAGQSCLPPQPRCSLERFSSPTPTALARQ